MFKFSSLLYKTLVLGLLWLSLCPPLVAQWTISGTVTDDDGTALDAAIVTLDNVKHIGTYTDEKGHYKLTLPDSLQSAQVLSRYLGYKTETFTIKQPQKGKSRKVKRDFVLSDGLAPLEVIVIVDVFDKLEKSSEMDVTRKSEVQGMGAQVSLGEVLNTVPGVKFDERGAGGSRRLSIRGSVVRSPFGVQNVKAYFAGAPLTSPDGSTPLEIVDLTDIESIEVQKGPQGDEFGPGNGGVLQISPDYQSSQGKWGGNAQFRMGSYGLRHWVLSSGYQTEKTKVVVRYIGQEYTGYRAQEANRKNMVVLHAQHETGPKSRDGASGWVNWKAWASAWYYQGKWELPGALTAAEAADNPRQALPYSENAQAAVDRKRGRLIIGLARQTEINLLQVTVYGNLTSKLNPYGSSPFFQGYKDESAAGAGIRFHLQQQLFRRRTAKLRLTLGTELQSEGNQFAEFENLSGLPGPIRARNRSVSSQWHVFSSLRYQSSNSYLQFATGLNQVRYNLQDELNSSNLSANIGFRPALLPSLTYFWSNRYKRPETRFTARIASGYSPPSRAEMLRDNGALDIGLQPEKTLGLELRPAINLLKRLLTLETNVYHYQVSQAILPQELGSGEVVYRNAGRIRQNGIEGMVRWKATTYPGTQRYGSIVGKVALQNYRFADYVNDSTDFSGNQVPGVPLYTASLRAEGKFFKRFFPSAVLRYQGRTPANDANSVFQEAFSTLNMRLAFRFGGELTDLYSRENDYGIELFVGVNNLLNNRYTSYLNLNAFGGRYFNPSPGINVYAGLNFQF